MMTLNVEELRELRREGAKQRRQESTKEETQKYFKAATIIKQFINTVLYPTVLVEAKKSYTNFEPYYLENFGVDMSAMLDIAWLVDKANHQPEIKGAMTDIHKLVKTSIPDFVKNGFKDTFSGLGEITVTDSWTQYNYILIEIKIYWKE